MAVGQAPTTAGPPAPAGQQPEMPMERQLFRPQEEGETLGGELTSMLWKGRVTTNTQKSRWLVNRKMYRGEQYLNISRTGVRSLAPTDRLPNGIRRVTINRIRPFVDARIAMFTYKRPDFEVRSVSTDLQSIEARRVATKLVDAQWGHDGWDVDSFARTSLLYAEQDGLCFGHVYYDGTVGRSIETMIDAKTGQPVQDPEMAAAYREADPTGMVLWKLAKMNEGDVKMRAVRASSLSIDPFARTDPRQAKWIIEEELMPRHQVEQIAGMKLADIIKRSKAMTGTDEGGNNASPKMPDSQFMDADGTGEMISSRDALTVRHAYIKKTGEYGRWPKGAHILWLDMAPDSPILIEPFDEVDLPYIAFTPRHDGGHFLKAMSIIDDLSPVQVAFNRVVSMLHEWLDLVGRPPLIVQNGVLRSKSIFNESRIVNVNGGQPPYFMGVPSEPTSVFTFHLGWLLDQMKEISSQQDATRGQAPGKGIDAAVSLDMLIQQNEQTTSGYTNAYKGYLERCLSRALKLTADNYTLPRLIAGAVGDDPSAFRDFVGSKIRGATILSITGPITPKARAQQIDLLLQLAQYTQGRFDPSKWVTQMLEGNIDEIIAGERAQQQLQKREIDEILAIAQMPNADQLYADFQELVQTYVQSVQMIQQQDGEGSNPMAELRQRRTRPPTLADIGIKIPQVEEGHDDPYHIMIIDEFTISPAWKYQHPLVKMAVHQHRLMHQQRIAQRVHAIAAQDAESDPNAPADAGGGSDPAQDSGPEMPGANGPDPTIGETQ